MSTKTKIQKNGPVVTKDAKGNVIKEEAPRKGKKGKRGVNLDDPFMRQLITVNRVDNPKRKGSSAAKRFALYKPGMTVAEYITAGGTRGDVNWDVEHEHITLTPAKKAK